MLAGVELITDNVPAWLTFFGALLVATIAALTASSRQKAQLDHDRQLHDLGELRSVLDEAAAVAYIAANALAEGINAAEDWFTNPSSDKARLRSQDARRAALDARSRAEAMSARVALRRGLGDEVYAAYASFMLGCGDIAYQLPWKTPPRASVAHLGESHEQLNKIRFAFIEKAQRIVGSEITKES